MISVTLNSFVLTAIDNKVKVVIHDSAPDTKLNSIEMVRRDREKLVSYQYGPKKITISGIITGTDRNDLETNIDNFKKSVYVTEINLDIEYVNSTRQYKVSPASINIGRDSFHNTFAPFEIELIALDPAGKSTATESKSWTNITANTLTAIFTAEGTLYPEPITTIDVHSATAFSELEIKSKTTGDHITLNGLFSAEDEIVIDNDNLSVKKNATEMDYDGIFPKFEIGQNKVIITAIATDKDYDLTITYTPRWL